MLNNRCFEWDRTRIELKQSYRADRNLQIRRSIHHFNYNFELGICVCFRSDEFIDLLIGDEAVFFSIIKTQKEIVWK